MTAKPFGPVLRHLRRLAPPAAEPASDRALLERFADSHGEAAFAELVRRHGPLVQGVCRRLLRDIHAADDAFQATFLLLATRAGSPTAGTSPGKRRRPRGCRAATDGKRPAPAGRGGAPTRRTRPRRASRRSVRAAHGRTPARQQAVP